MRLFDMVIDPLELVPAPVYLRHAYYKRELACW